MSFDGGHKWYSLLGFLLDVISWAGVITQVYHPSEPVQAVSDGDIQGLAENAVSLLGVSDDLGVASGDIEHNRILCTGDLPTHLDV